MPLRVQEGMKSHFLKRKTIIQKPIAEVFEFFSKAENLNQITPTDLSFTITSTLPIEMKKGALIEYKIKLSGLAFNWQTEISDWNPPHSFIDKQLKGPYKIWIHEHRFVDKGTFTEMYDTVEYLSPGWILEPWINKFFIERKVNEIFDYRESKLKALFGA